MIVFNGHLTGSAEERFVKRTVEYAQTQFIVGAVLAIPMTPGIARLLHVQLSTKVLPYLSGAVCAVFLLGMLLVRIPKSKKVKQACIPYRIYCEDDFIVCISEKDQVYRKISDVTKVRDRGDFYEVVFRLSKYSEKFICQKDLLTKGSLGEFEALFEGKIERK